jgi:hypothetical protein
MNSGSKPLNFLIRNLKMVVIGKKAILFSHNCIVTFPELVMTTYKSGRLDA